MRIGSLCSGIGGLDIAARLLLEEAGQPGHVAWVAENNRNANDFLAKRMPGIPNLGDITQVSSPEGVEVITAGFPCQPVSGAGRKKGTEDERWVWPSIQRIVGDMEPRPRLLLLENVPGLLTSNGGGAMARVVQGLASLGYVGSWRIVRASDVGACHRRRRVFIVAHRGGFRAAPWHWSASPAKKYLPTPVAAGAVRGPDYARVQRRKTHGSGGDDLPTAVALLPSPVEFGKFEQAVAHHAEVFGRPPPPATVNNRRLNPSFVEWMMGYPEGWVTDLGLTRTATLKLLGNSVVPLQAYAAFSSLTKIEEMAA